MKKIIITYGTWDLFHYGHYMLLKRAKALGDYLIVGVSTDEFCLDKKGKVCVLPFESRKQIVSDLKFVDQVIPECCMAQKIEDIKKYNVDVFVLGDDYKDKFKMMDEFEYVNANCKIMFLERTPDISTSVLKSRLFKQININKIL